MSVAADSKEIEWTGLKFSPDGKSILISTNGSVIKLIDSYNGSSLQSFTGHLNSKQLPLEASFSPDSQFVISGSSDGRIHIWNSENGQKVCVLNGDHRSPVQCVQVRWGNIAAGPAALQCTRHGKGIITLEIQTAAAL